MTQATKKKPLRFWLGTVLSALSLTAILLLIKPAEVFEALRSSRHSYLLISATGIIAFLFARAFRWRLLLGPDVDVIHAFHVQNIGYMISNLLPLRVGDIARAVLIGNVPSISFARGMSTVVLERLLDMLFVVSLLPFTLSAVQRIPDWMRAAALLSAILALALLSALVAAANSRNLIARLSHPLIERLPEKNRGAWSERLGDLLDGLGGLTSRVTVIKLVGYTILLWAPIVGAYYAALMAVGLRPTWPMTGFVFCAAAFSVAAPSSPAQVGVFHASVIAALKVLGQPEAEAAAFAFLYHALNLAIMVIMGRIGLPRSGVTLSQLMAATRQATQSQG